MSAAVSRRLRERVIRRDGYRCALCGKEETFGLEVDHIRPRARGGTNDLTNLRLAHPACNRAEWHRIARLEREAAEEMRDAG